MSAIRRLQVNQQQGMAGHPENTLVAPSASHSATVIFLHGLGDTGQGWFEEIKSLQRQHPHIRVVCPTAPLQSVTLNGGMLMTAWHDLTSLDDICAQEFGGIERNKDIIMDLLRTEAALVPSQRIVLGGFSQGAAMAMYVGLQYPEALGGIVALSGYLPSYERMEEMAHESNKHTPVLGCHGDIDPVVNIQAGQLAHDTIKKFNPNAEFHVFPHMAHSSSHAEMAQVFAFIAETLK